MNQYRHQLRLLLLAALTLTPAPTLTAEPLEYLFFELKPRMYLVDGEVQGPVALHAMEIFRAAGFDVNLIAGLPYRRTLTLLRESVPNRCSAGWFLTTEREALYRYSLPILTDPNFYVVATQKNADRIRQHANFVDVLRDSHLSLGSVKGLSLGKSLDELIYAYGAKNHSLKDFRQMLRMLVSGRIDYVLAEPSTYEAIFKQENLDINDFARISFDDMPNSEKRYIICTRATPLETMSALNQAIKSKGQTP